MFEDSIREKFRQAHYDLYQKSSSSVNPELKIGTAGKPLLENILEDFYEQLPENYYKKRKNKKTKDGEIEFQKKLNALENAVNEIISEAKKLTNYKEIDWKKFKTTARLLNYE